MYRWILALPFAFIGSPTPARALGGDGHRIVCAIAWDELQPSVKAKTQSILDIQTKDQFADACIWADVYRPDHPETAPWHYVNVPKGATTVDVERDCREPQTCVVVQIERQLEILKSEAPKEQRAMALKFILHFVGDIHQRLHSSHAEDRGGNRIRGEFMGRKMDMHGIWDTALIEAAGLPWQDIANDLGSTVSHAQRLDWVLSRPINWANESLSAALSTSVRYNNQSQGFTWGEEYVTENLPLVLDRMTRAGIRLGNELNLVFLRD
jgi:hypothetical protein